MFVAILKEADRRTPFVDGATIGSIAQQRLSALSGAPLVELSVGERREIGELDCRADVDRFLSGLLAKSVRESIGDLRRLSYFSLCLERRGISVQY